MRRRLSGDAHRVPPESRSKLSDMSVKGEVSRRGLQQKAMHA